MIKLVNSLVELTSLRDREELEIILALAAVDLSGASAGRLWRLVHHGGRLRLHERACLADSRILVSDLPTDPAELPLIESDPDLQACFDSRAAAPVGRGAPSLARHVFPVASAGGIVGFLDIHRPTPLSDEQRRLIGGLLRIYRNHLTILDYSENDELTGLLNRKTFEAAFAHFKRIEAPPRRWVAPMVRIERRRPPRPDLPRWLAVLDIDFFKRVNDRYGHAMGDEVLILMAQLMRGAFREADCLFRCGGEEFIVIMQPTEADHSGAVLERFRAAVEAHTFPTVGSITISAGYTRIGAEDSGLAAFRRADEALYAAKQGGRNQVICFEQMTGAAPLAAANGLAAGALVH